MPSALGSRKASGPERVGGEILNTARTIVATDLATATVAPPGAEAVQDAFKVAHVAPAFQLDKPGTDPKA